MPTKALLIKFHTILKSSGITDDEKYAMLNSYGVDSSKDLNDKQLIDLITKLLGQSKEYDESDQWRKRVIASIGAYLRILNKDESIDYIKSIACQASGSKNFNKIPLANLRSIYYEFKKKCEINGTVNRIKKGLVNEMISCN